MTVTLIISAVLHGQGPKGRKLCIPPGLWPIGGAIVHYSNEVYSGFLQCGSENQMTWRGRSPRPLLDACVISVILRQLALTFICYNIFVFKFRFVKDEIC